MGVNTVKRKRSTGTRYQVRWYRSEIDPVVNFGTFESEEEADARRDKVRAMIAAGQYPTLAALEFKGGGRVKNLAELWLASRIEVCERTREHDVTHARKAVAKFGPRDPRSITTDEVEAWVAELHAIGYERGTIKNIVKKGFSQMMAFGVKKAWVDENPVLGVKLPHGGKRRVEQLPTKADWLLVRGRLRGPAVDCFDLITHGGLRISEACELTWREVDGSGRLVCGGKGGTPLRWVGVLPYQPDWMPRMPKDANLDDTVCWPLTPYSFRYQLAKACEKVGVMRFDEKREKHIAAIHPHLMRKLCASLMLVKLNLPLNEGGHGLEIVTMAARLGHTQEEFLKTYSTLIPPADWR